MKYIAITLASGDVEYLNVDHISKFAGLTSGSLVLTRVWLLGTRDYLDMQIAVDDLRRTLAPEFKDMRRAHSDSGAET